MSEQKLWFVYDPEDGVEFFATEAEAVAEAESHIDGFLCDTWDESVESLIVGRVTHWAERVDVVHPDDPRWAEVAGDRTDIGFWCNYTMRAVKP